jgi:phage repressor protein C with HTH and peptisase S24 domain/DNA-binding XRE family transcriptional regulator
MSREKMRKTDNFEKKIIAPRLKEIREYFSLNQAEFASFLGVGQNDLSRYENGVHEFYDELKKKLVDFVMSKYEKRINVDWLLTGEGEMFLKSPEKALINADKTGFKRVPIYSESDLPEGAFVVPLLNQRLSAGGGAYLPEEDAVTALVRVPKYLARFGDKIAALTVEGDSMHPTLSRGDMVVCDSCGWTGEGVYALREGGTGLVKRLTKASGKFVIISDNPKYPKREEPEESQAIEIIGRVHCALKKFE